MDSRASIIEIGPAEAGEIFTLQRAAYVTESQLYDDPHLPALTQTLAELEAELLSVTAFGAFVAGRLVGSVRITKGAQIAEIGRLVVAPDQQRRGIGGGLMEHIHAHPPADAVTFELFTGHLSESNLNLYRRLRYRETERRRLSDSVELVYLQRPVRL